MSHDCQSSAPRARVAADDAQTARATTLHP
jgi:hypothetical protein